MLWNILDNSEYSRGIECIVSVETGKRWRRICNQFDKVQDEMEEEMNKIQDTVRKEAKKS